MMKEFPIVIQTTWKNCGPTCVKIIAEYYGMHLDENSIDDTGLEITLLELSDAFEKLGFKTMALRCDFDELSANILLPCVVHWKNGHYLVVYDIQETSVKVSDPASGLMSYDIESFIDNWTADNEVKKGIVLSIEN